MNHFVLAGFCLLILAGCGSNSGNDDADSAATRDVLVVSNNWEGTADFIDPQSFQRLLRLDIVPDKSERLAEIRSNPVRYAEFLGVRTLIGEGHDQLVDDGFTSLDGRRLYVSRPSFSDVVAFDLATRQILWRTPVEGYRSDHMAISPDGTRLAVSASTTKQVHMIDTASGTIVGSFASGDQPHENNFSKDGKRIFHASIGTVYTPLDVPVFDTTKGERVFEVVDAQTLQVLKKIDIGAKLEEAGYPGMSSAVRPMAISPDERLFYFQVSFFHGFVEFDLEQEHVLRVATLPNAVPDTPRSQYPLDSAHHGLTMDPQGKQLCAAGTVDNYIALVDRASLAYKILPTGDTPYWSTTSSDGRYCFVSIAGADQIAVVDYGKQELVATIPVGDHPQRSRMGRLLETLVDTGS
jgi:DNA-binding beta-propeller fold protein YncE